MFRYMMNPDRVKKKHPTLSEQIEDFKKKQKKFKVTAEMLRGPARDIENKIANWRAVYGEFEIE